MATNKMILEAVTKLVERFDIQEKRMEELSKKMEENCSLVAVLREEVNEFSSGAVTAVYQT